jgi:ankyrin repeat protein
MISILSAVMTGNAATLDNALLANGDLEEKANDGSTPLTQATIQGALPMVRKLIQHGASLNAQNIDGWAALHFAAQEYKVEIAHLLIDNGAIVDVQDNHGNTPLWRAVFSSQGRREMIETLLRAGANPNRANRHGVSPKELAQNIANYDVAGILAEFS